METEEEAPPEREEIKPLNINVNKTLNVINVQYKENPRRFKNYSFNSITGYFIADLSNDMGIETNLLNKNSSQYTFEMFESINGVAIRSNNELFKELEKLL